MQLLETELVIKQLSIHKKITSCDCIGYSYGFSGESNVKWQGKKQFIEVFISSIQLLVDRFRDDLNASNIEASN